MVVYVVYGGAMRKWWWYAEVYVGTGTKFGEIWKENGAVDGDVAAKGWMSELDGRMYGLSGRMSGLWIRGRTRRTPRGEVKSGEKFGRLCGWKLAKRWGKARSTCNTRNLRIKSNKTSSHQQITKKKLGLFLVGIFGFRTKITKSS